MNNNKGVIYDMVLIAGLILITTIFVSVVEVVDDTKQSLNGSNNILSAFNG